VQHALSRLDHGGEIHPRPPGVKFVP
jgi:hypothetical protein